MFDEKFCDTSLALLLKICCDPSSEFSHQCSSDEGSPTCFYPDLS